MFNYKEWRKYFLKGRASRYITIEPHRNNTGMVTTSIQH